MLLNIQRRIWREKKEAHGSYAHNLDPRAQKRDAFDSIGTTLFTVPMFVQWPENIVGIR